ncbi:MAG: EAL domain-containing protein [Methyloceanibacter sp.]|uniref:EAL domain-containing protein n=1 Tax=Methyloceanibacter sp. TaxID=1965321 RepID=UPI003D9BBDA7
MDRSLRERYALQHDLRSAIAHGELSLDYQPQASIDGAVFGFEALLRWHHPRRGLVPPTTFIPLAEQCGLIGELGEWALRNACIEATSWRCSESARCAIGRATRQDAPRSTRRPRAIHRKCGPGGRPLIRLA